MKFTPYRFTQYRLGGIVLGVCMSLFAVASLSAAGHEDDFEDYATGTVVRWDEGKGGKVVDEETFSLLGSPNKSLELASGSQRLLSKVSDFSKGGISTFSFDFVELSGGPKVDGLQVGFGAEPDLNAKRGALAVRLNRGMIQFNQLGPNSSLTWGETGYYELDQPHRLYLIANDSEAAVITSEGGEELAPGRYEVWLRSGLKMRRILEGTFTKPLNYGGFRTWRSSDARFYIDRVRLVPGVHLETDTTICSLDSVQAATVEGGKVTLAWSAAGLPEESTYELRANGAVAFADERNTGEATSGHGEIDATIVSAPSDAIEFSLLIRDGEGKILCEGRKKIQVFDYSKPARFPHPSVTSTAEQLAFMRDQVLNHPDSLTKVGWDALRATKWASKGYKNRPQKVVSVVPAGTNASENAFRNDAHAARAHALQWVVTGDPVFRDKALAIVNETAQHFVRIESTGSKAQVHLESAWILPVWLSAADILRYYDGGAAGWDPADLAVFHQFVDQLYEHAKRAMQLRSNWGVSATFAAMAYGVWSDDPEVFQMGLKRQLELLETISEESGYIVETCRDTWHPQYTVVTWVDSAELARHVGHPELYEAKFGGQEIPRLAVVLEYFANMMLGNTEAPCEEGWRYDYRGAYRGFDNYEVAYNHYLNREEADYLPVFQEMVENHWRKTTKGDAHFLLWSRLTHGNVP